MKLTAGTSFRCWLLLATFQGSDSLQAVLPTLQQRPNLLQRGSSDSAFGAQLYQTPNIRKITVTQLFGDSDDRMDSDKINGETDTPLNDDRAQPAGNMELEVLQEKMLDQSAVLMGLEVAMEEIQTVLNNKQAELEKRQDSYSQEKTSFVAQIAALKANLLRSQQANQDDSESQNEWDDEYRAEQERLQREIKLLKNQQVQVGARLEQERDVNDELQQRLGKLNDSLEFEQMLFFKEKKKMQENIVQQKKQLSEIEKKLERAQDRFGESQQDLKCELQQEQERLAASEAEIRRIQAEYKQGQNVLQEQVKEEERNLREAERQLKSERRKSQQERNRLQAQLEQEQTTLAGLEDAIEQEIEHFNSMKPVLEQTMEEEKRKVEELSERLQKEQDRFATEKNGLQERIEVEQMRLEKIENELRSERSKFENVKSKLTFEQALIQIRRADDRSRMSSRYNALREALQDRILEEKQHGREDLKTMTQRYENKLEATQEAIARLEDQVSIANESVEGLQLIVNEVKAQTQQIYKDKQIADMRYQRLISDRNAEIGTLQKSMSTLEVTEKECEERIQRVESSYREIAKYSIKLTGRRLNKVNPFRLIKRNKTWQ